MLFDLVFFIEWWGFDEYFQKYRQAYETQVQRGEPSAVAAFTYAHGLIHGNDRNARMGISLLEGWCI